MKKIKDDEKLKKANEFHKLRTAFMIIENKVSNKQYHDTL